MTSTSSRLVAQVHRHFEFGDGFLPTQSELSEFDSSLSPRFVGQVLLVAVIRSSQRVCRRSLL